MTLKGQESLVFVCFISNCDFTQQMLIVRLLVARSRVLKQLYSDGSAYKDYNLVVVGHSLGGGVAQVLSLMLRPSFPSLRCFAYEPPVRIII